MDVEGFLRDLFGRLHVTEMSCALIYFSLVEYFSFVFEKLPILPRIPLFLFSVTSTLTALSFMTFWFALQRFVKTVLTFGFGLDDALVSIILQPSFALIVAVWSVDVALDGFCLPTVSRLLASLLFRSFSSLLRSVAFILTKLLKILLFPIKCIFKLAKYFLCQCIGILPILTLVVSFSIFGAKGTWYSICLSLLKDFSFQNITNLIHLG